MAKNVGFRNKKINFLITNIVIIIERGNLYFSCVHITFYQFQEEEEEGEAKEAGGIGGGDIKDM